MKPFNLEEALAGKPVVTREGQTVIIAGYNHEAQPTYQVIGWLDNIARSWNVDGEYHRSENHYDLFMKPETAIIKGWVNIYPNNRTSKIHQSKEIADYCAADDRIACTEVEVSYEI